jgi:hypothetical protein
MITKLMITAPPDTPGRDDHEIWARASFHVPPTGETPLGRGRWHIDHDHVTGQVRGLLCNNCNRGIGYFGDDPQVMTAAARYVATHRQLKLPAAAG